MKRLLSDSYHVILYCSFVILGILLGKFYNFPYFEIAKEVDLVSIFSILITIWLAILITTYFDKRKNDNRIEKDIILRKVDKVYDILCDLQMESVTGEIPYAEAAASIKRVNTSMQSIYTTVKKCEFTIDDDIKENIQNETTNLRDLLTNTPAINDKQIDDSSLPAIEVREGIIHLNKVRISQIELKFDLIKDLILELEIRINKK